jgi:hypothetical protein
MSEWSRTRAHRQDTARKLLVTLATCSSLLGLAACSDSPVMPEIEGPRHSLLTSTPLADLAVSNLAAVNGTRYLVATGGMGNGAKAYSDRAYTYQNVPDLVQGKTHIQTRQGDMAVVDKDAFLSFSINREAVVHVAYHGTSVPGWMSAQGFSATGQTLVIAKSGEQQTFHLYARTFPAGTVTLGSNLPGTSGAEMYTVIVKPTTQINQLNVDLTWTDASGNEDSFRVIRRTQNGDGSWGGWGWIASPPRNATSYRDATVRAGTTYEYNVRSCNPAGCSSWSGAKRVTTPG